MHQKVTNFYPTNLRFAQQKAVFKCSWRATDTSATSMLKAMNKKYSGAVTSFQQKLTHSCRSDQEKYASESVSKSIYAL